MTDIRPSGTVSVPGLVHGTCIVIGRSGVILRGPSGSGKSDLALRMIDEGALLLADDQVVLSPRDGCLWASAPSEIRGLIEVRGVGLVRLDPARLADRACVTLISDLGGPIERLPDESRETLMGISVRRIRLDPFAGSASVKLRLAAGSRLGTVMPLG